VIKVGEKALIYAIDLMIGRKAAVEVDVEYFEVADWGISICQIDAKAEYVNADRGEVFLQLKELAKLGAVGYVIIIWSVDGDIIRYDVGLDTNDEGLPVVYTTDCHIVMDE
jgi:hypothetical protein